jgi:predicted NBD/HSP70 family sugar kinase
VRYGRPVAEPYNLGSGWVGFDYSQLARCPLRIMNDACMQALGSYDGGRMLFLGLGTSVGTALIYDGTIVPLALGHWLVEEGVVLEDNLNRAALEASGDKRWNRDVAKAVEVLRSAFNVDYVVLGGGNAKRVAELPAHCVRGENRRAFYGGLRMWDDIRQHDEETYHITRHALDH